MKHARLPHSHILGGYAVLECYMDTVRTRGRDLPEKPDLLQTPGARIVESPGPERRPYVGTIGSARGLEEEMEM